MKVRRDELACSTRSNDPVSTEQIDIRDFTGSFWKSEDPQLLGAGSVECAEIKFQHAMEQPRPFSISDASDAVRFAFKFFFFLALGVVLLNQELNDVVCAWISSGCFKEYSQTFDADPFVSGQIRKRR